jgi:hypothetical protein
MIGESDKVDASLFQMWFHNGHTSNIKMNSGSLMPAGPYAGDPPGKDLFRFAGNSNNANERYQFWQQDYHPVALTNADIASQRLNYLHENPVRAGIVWEPQHYKYSSAGDYYNNTPGLLKLEMLL